MLKKDVLHMYKMSYKATFPRRQEFFEVTACMYMLKQLEEERGCKLEMKHVYNGGQFKYSFDYGNDTQPVTYIADGAVFLDDIIVWIGNNYLCF